MRKRRGENRGHMSEGREQQELLQYILPYVFINLKDVVLRFMVSRRDKNDKVFLTRSRSHQKSFPQCVLGTFLRVFPCYPTQCSPTTFEQGMKMQMISNWKIGGEAQKCEPCYTAELQRNLKPGHQEYGVSPGYHPKGVCLDSSLRKERHYCHLVGEDPEH